jgi:broad specificity phosphatase PhoE
MECRKMRIYSLLAALTILLGVSTVCFCAEEDDRRGNEKKLELTDEMIERIMQRIEESNPEKAEELQQLREQDAEKFEEELRKVIQAYNQERRRYFQRRAEEYLEWLGENYPDEADRLARVKEEKPDRYERNLLFSYRRYEDIMEASEEDPELAEVLKQELQLKIERDRLVLKIKSTDDEQQKEKLAEQLKEVVSERFDLIIKRKQITYKRLLARLERLKKEAEEGEISLKEFITEKEQNVEKRVEGLLSGERRFRWE